MDWISHVDECRSNNGPLIDAAQDVKMSEQCGITAQCAANN